MGKELPRGHFVNRVSPTLNPNQNTLTKSQIITDQQFIDDEIDNDSDEQDKFEFVQDLDNEDFTDIENQDNNSGVNHVGKKKLLRKYKKSVTKFFKKYLTNNYGIQFNKYNCDQGDGSQDQDADDMLLCHNLDHLTCPPLHVLDKIRYEVGPFGEIVGRVSTDTRHFHSKKSFSSRHSKHKSVQLVDVDVQHSESEESLDGQRGRCKRFCKKLCPYLTRDIPVKVSDYVVKLNPEKRAENTLDYIVETYKRLVDHHMEMQQNTEENKKLVLLNFNLVETFKHCKNAIHFMHRVHLFCGDAMKSLSYYFESDLTEEQLKLVEGRSLVGSYMWVIIMCMKSIRSTVDYSSEDFDETKRTLEDVVGLSFVIWRGVKHICEAFIQCRKKTEDSVLTKYIDRFDPKLNINRYLKTQASAIQTMEGVEMKSLIKSKTDEIHQLKKKLADERKLRLRQLKLHNKVGGNAEILEVQIQKGDPIPSPPAVRIAKKLLVGVTSNNGDENGQGWTPFDGFKSSDRLATLNSLCKKVVQIYEEVHGHLRSLDKYLHQIMHDDSITYETSYYEAVGFLNKYLGKITKYRHLLRPEDCEALVEMGKILNDELNLTEFFIMTLRKLAHESRNAIHVSYEFARLFQRCSLPPYELISPPDIRHCRGLERLGVKESLEDIEFRNVTFRQVVSQFNTSPYIDILMVFPVRGKNYQLRVQPLPNIKMDSFSLDSNYPPPPKPTVLTKPVEKNPQGTSPVNKPLTPVLKTSSTDHRKKTSKNVIIQKTNSSSKQGVSNKVNKTT